MNTEPKIFAQFLATIAWADEEYNTVEKASIQNIAERWGMPELPLIVEHYINQIQHFTGTEVTSSLSDIVTQVHADDKNELLSACLQLMGCDNYLANEEISNYFVIASILGIREERALQLFSELTTEDEAIID